MPKGNINTKNILRNTPDVPFSMVPHELVRDENIPSNSRFLWVLMNGYAVDWEFNRKHLMNVTGWGRDKLSSAINGLKDAGLLDIVQVQDAAGKFERNDWRIFNRVTEKPLAAKPVTLRRTTSKNINSKKTLQKSEEVFEKLWSQVYPLVPAEKKSYFSKKISKTRFLKIVNRKKDRIPATRLANAIMWYYADIGQTKNDRQFMKTMQYVLRDELFDDFLKKGVFRAKSINETGPTMHDVWRRRGERYLRTGWDAQWMDRPVRLLEREYWVYFPKADWIKLGWSE